MILGYTVFFHILQQRFMQLQELLEPIGAFVPVRMFQLKVRFFYQEGRVQIPLHSMSADLHYNVLDPARNVSPPPEIGHKKCPDFSRQKKRADCSTLSQELFLLTGAQLQGWLYA